MSILFFFIIEYFLAWAKTDNVLGISEITVQGSAWDSEKPFIMVSLLKRCIEHKKDQF